MIDLAIILDKANQHVIEGGYLERERVQVGFRKQMEETLFTKILRSDKNNKLTCLSTRHIGILVICILMENPTKLSIWEIADNLFKWFHQQLRLNQKKIDFLWSKLFFNSKKSKDKSDTSSVEPFLGKHLSISSQTSEDCIEMGGCASMNTNQTKSDVQVRKVKLTLIRVKQREETKRAAIAKQQVYFGEDLSTNIVLEQYSKQGYLLAAGGLRTVSSFLVVTSQEQKAAKIFQPMLKNMVLDHQESFPKWLTDDEQFRNDQMQEFLQKCQETAKLQSADISAFPHSEDENDHESDGHEGGDENDEDGDESPQNQKNKITQFNKKSKVSSSSSSKNKDNRGGEESDGDDEDDDQDISQISEGGKLPKSQNNTQPTKQSKNASKISNKDKDFVRTKSIIEDKSLISKKNAVEESESDNKLSDDDEEGRQHVDMQKFQDIQGLKNSQKNNNSRIHSNSRNNSVGGKQGAKGSQQNSSDVVPSLRAIKNEGQDMDSSGGRNKAHSHAQSIHSQNLTARGARASNGTNIYVIKEFKIIKNNWINQAICLAEIQTSTSILEFKRRYFYEFDKLSAFLSYLLALKRMNFPNLLTFSYVQIGEASYSGDLAELKKRTEAQKSQQNQQYNLKVIEPTDQKPKDTSNNTPVSKRTLKRTGTLLLANSQLMASQKQSSKVNFNEENNEDEEDDEEESRLIMFVDRIFPDCGKSLEEVINSTSPGEDILRICTKGFKIFDAIANTLCKMHRAGFSYRVLRPSMVRIFHSGAKEFTAYLDSPDFIWRETELNYISKNVATEADFMLYDCKCLSALMIHYFLAIQDIKQKRRDSHREVNPSMIFSQSNANSPVKPNQNLETLNPGTLKNVTSQNLIPNGNNSVGSLQCISNIPSFSEIVSIQDQEELQNIIKKLKIPLVAVETLDQLAIADLHSQKSIEEFAVKIQGVLEKGPQIAFKHDSLSAYLSYHGSHPLKNENNHVYFRRKNQVHFYEFESKTFKVIKLIRKKAKFQVRTHLTFCHYDNCFYFFAAPNSSKVVKIPLNTNSTQRHVINQKSEVVFFKSVKNIPIEEPQILSVIPDDFSFSLYIFNSRKNTDETTNDVYYNSFIISIQYKQDNPLVDDWKEKIQIFEGPRNYTWRRKAFHFYDPHNKFIYCILDSNNIFEKGIRFSYFDTSIEKGDFKDGNLRFACSTQEVYEQFCDLSMNVEAVEFCVEVQHGVFLLQASKNIYVLDFNYKCFYSFSTLKQLHNYKKNNHKHPHRYQYAYEILNQPFEIKFNNALNLGKNVVFQEGMLHILGRKEIETVICSYELLPTQGVMVLKKCVSLHSFDDILLKIPIQIVDIWNFQEFKKIVFEQEEKSAQTAMQGVIASHQNITQQGLGSFNNLPVVSGETPNPNTALQPPIATRTFANNINNNNNNLTVPLANNALYVKQSQQTIALSSQNNLTALPDKSRGSNPENGIHVPENQMHHNNLANSKQQEVKLQQFISKISSMSAGMDGTNICEANMYHENQYKILKVQQETNEYRMVRIMHQSGAFSVRRVDINNIELYEQYISLLELNPPSNYLMQVRQCFMNQDDETGGLTANIVEEDSEACLLDELRKRCIDKTFYKSQELGQILKALFKAIIGLQTIELAHGCIHPRLIYFTRKGFIRLAGWYLENREGFQNDFIDACSLIYQIATLEFDENQPLRLTSTILQSNQEKLKAYPGLFSFLLNNLLILQDGENLQTDHISEDIREIYQSLQVNYLKINKESLSSSNKHIFWVGYGSNYVISCYYEELTFVKNEVFFHNNISYKFSKYNMFTFDQERTMYMSGALKEDFKTPSQLFYSMDFSFIHLAKLKLRQLKDIPNSILQPSLFFCNDYVYCIGGYYIKFDGSKNISKKAYRYSIKSEDWEQISDMPVSVVSATVIAGKDNQILYLFGGVSEEVDLRGKELNYLTYDIEMDEWNLKIDLSIRSPFVNNRYVKPTIDHIGNNIFISVQRTHEAIFVQFFELVKGGINIKFRIDEEKEDIIKEQFAEIDIFNEIKYQDYFRTYQDDLSLIFVHDTVYLLDEFSNALLTINFANFNNIKYERVPCGLIAIEKNNVIDKQLSLDRKSSVDSFYFNGY